MPFFFPNILTFFRLSIVPAHPVFLVKPRDQRVGMNGIAKFDCVAEGNPPPSVFWKKEGSQVMIHKGKNDCLLREIYLFIYL